MRTPFNPGPLVLGTWRFLDGPSPLSSADIRSLFEVSLASGIDCIDTAEIYGEYTVEAAIGKSLSESLELKEKLRFVTKAGIDIPSSEKSHAEVCHYNATAENLQACCEKSLRLLQLDAVDLFLVHRPDWLTPPEETARGLSEILDRGLAKHVGVSNYTIHQYETLDRLMDGRLTTNQVEFSPFHMDPIYGGTFDQCQQKGIRPMAWSPLAGGALFDAEDEAGKRVRACLEGMREFYDGASVDALVYAWIQATPSSPSVILGTSKAERIESAAQATQISLERQDWYRIWEAAQGTSVP